MNITMTREEVREVLSVAESTMRDIVKSKRLKIRLHEKGFTLINTYKDGRNTIYEVEPVDLDYWEQVQIYYNVKKTIDHDTYTIARLTDNGLIKSRSKLLRDNNIEISGSTAKRYDDILENEGYIMKDKTTYVYYNKTSGEFRDITKEEYLSFWKDVSYCKELLYDNRRKLNKYEISQDTYDYRNLIILDSVGKEKGEIAMKFDTYKELQDTKDLVELIQSRNLVQ